MGTDAVPQDAPGAILELADVVAGYGKMTVLHGTRFAVRRGAITTIIGPNGAGKSTVFKAVFGLLPVQSGRVIFDGQDTTNFTPRELLELGGEAAGPGIDLPQRIDALMSRFPMLRERADAQASTLSGGQQKLLEVARGLLLDPKLVLIDEPSIGLSPRLVRETFDILGGLRDKGVSILMVEQNAKSALEHSDYGIVLEQGQTRMEGEARAILADRRIAQLFLGGGLVAETS